MDLNITFPFGRKLCFPLLLTWLDGKLRWGKWLIIGNTHQAASSRQLALHSSGSHWYLTWTTGQRRTFQSWLCAASGVSLPFPPSFADTVHPCGPGQRSTSRCEAKEGKKNKTENSSNNIKTNTFPPPDTLYLLNSDLLYVSQKFHLACYPWTELSHTFVSGNKKIWRTDDFWLVLGQWQIRLVVPIDRDIAQLK